MSEERSWVIAEVGRQLAPVSLQVAEVQRQNSEQSADLEKLASKQNSLDKWRCALWGNGSGTPGYLEKAREEDKRAREEDRKQVAALFSVVTELRERILREEGKETLRQEIAKNRAEIRKIRDDRRAAADVAVTNRWSRLQIWIAIGFTVGGSFTGAWFLSLVRPMARHLVAYLMQVIG